MNAALDLLADSSPERGHKPAHTGLRTCVGCRQRDERPELVHLVAIADRDRPSRWQVMVDERGRLPGRGAWLHPRVACVERALARQALGRALRVPAQVDTTPVQEWWAMHDAAASTDAADKEENRKRV